MDMTVSTILIILISHYIADFILQDEAWAANKSSDNFSLIVHTFVYSLFISIVIALWQDSIGLGLLFFYVTFITHTMIDWVTSRMTSHMFKTHQHGTSIPNVGVFSLIGLDQLLHYVQLILTYKLLFS